MKNKMRLLVSCLAFCVSSAVMADSIYPQWKCMDTMESRQMQVDVNVNLVVQGSRSSYQMAVTVFQPDAVVKEIHYGPYALTKKRGNPMSGVAELEGFPLSFLLGLGDDRDDVFGQLAGEIEGKSVVISLSCKDLRKNASLE